MGLLLLLMCMTSQRAKAQFVHPGGLHTTTDLNRMKTQVAAGAHPWIDDWNLLLTDPNASSTYVDHANANMGSSRQNADQDAHAAYLNALECYIAGTTANCNEAVTILNDWSSAVNQVPTGADTPGLVALPIEDFNIAAEVLRTYSGWSAASITAFKNMNTNYLYPVVNTFLTTHNGACISAYWPSWDSPNLDALIIMGVFNDNTSWFNQGVTYFESGAGTGAIDNAVFTLYSGGLGQELEIGRDQEHAQLALGTYGYAATIAQNQGTNLFDYNSSRLLAGAEYLAQYALEESVPYTAYNDCDDDDLLYPSINGRGRLDDRPVWELLYNHYVVKEGVSAPNIEAMANLYRPEVGSDDHLGYGTLTFTLSSTASPYPPSPTPATPSGLTATAAIGQVYLNWSPVATAKGYNILRSTNGGAYSNIATVTLLNLPQYDDTTVTNGTSYKYEVEATNQSGASSASAPSASVTPEAGGALPTGWSDANINGSTGNAVYSTVSSNNFLVTGAGTGIGGTADSFNFAYMQVTGNFTLTARLASWSGADLSNTGLMMRNSLADNDMAISLVLGSIGARIAEYGARTTSGGNMDYYTGNQFTVTPVWFRLARSGNTFTASQSPDGVNWFTIGSATIAMGSTYYVGLAASSGVSGTTETSNFDNVTPITGSGVGTLIPNGTYQIESVYSGLAIDDPGSSTALGTVMEQNPVTNGTDEQWMVSNLGNNVITLTNVASGLVLDVYEGTNSRLGSYLDQYTNNGVTWQEWNVISLGSNEYELTSVYSGYAVDVDGGVTTAGADIDQYTYNGNPWQQWIFVAVP
jgi:regulation of enolase protein 1 (concanavalin A-like superfamily)